MTTICEKKNAWRERKIEIGENRTQAAWTKKRLLVSVRQRLLAIYHYECSHPIMKIPVFLTLR